MNPWNALLRPGHVVVAPGIYDALTARLAKRHGFEAGLIGGYELGAIAGVSEPLLSETEVLQSCYQIKRSIDFPLLIDVGAGFGEPLHVIRLVKDLKLLGVEAMQIEDQIFPKRAHYFRDYKEHIVSVQEMADKLRWAKKTAGEDVFILARTDAYVTNDEGEAIRRCRAYLDAGADAVVAFPFTLEEARGLPEKVGGPVFYTNTRGNRVGRPVLTPRQALEFGYAALGDGHALFLPAFAAMEATLAQYTVEGGFPAHDDQITVRKHVETTIGVEELWQVENDTVEKGIS